MSTCYRPGLYGKLPAYGDFVVRNLTPSFVNEWDIWMQQFMNGTQERIGTDWLDIYLTSPLWRFVLSSGVIDENVWAGIVMPSVDKVGRYFPFSIVLKLPANINPLDFLSIKSGWFSEMETLALSALQGEIVLDELEQRLESSPLMLDLSYRRVMHKKGMRDLYAEIDVEEPLPFSVYPQFLDYCLSETFSSYSVWTTEGSERVAPCLFTTQHLPTMEKMSAMIDGQWHRWGCHQPYALARDSNLDSK